MHPMKMYDKNEAQEEFYLATWSREGVKRATRAFHHIMGDGSFSCLPAEARDSFLLTRILAPRIRDLLREIITLGLGRKSRGSNLILGEYLKDKIETQYKAKSFPKTKKRIVKERRNLLRIFIVVIIHHVIQIPRVSTGLLR